MTAKKYRTKLQVSAGGYLIMYSNNLSSNAIGKTDSHDMTGAMLRNTMQQNVQGNYKGI
jgi:hypothetical protein